MVGKGVLESCMTSMRKWSITRPCTDTSASKIAPGITYLMVVDQSIAGIWQNVFPNTSRCPSLFLRVVSKLSHSAGQADSVPLLSNFDNQSSHSTFHLCQRRWTAGDQPRANTFPTRPSQKSPNAGGEHIRSVVCFEALPNSLLSQISCTPVVRPPRTFSLGSWRWCILNPHRRT